MDLTEKDRAILESVERGEWRRVPGFAREKRRYEAVARATQRKDKRINIRMTERIEGRTIEGQDD
jgi:predicted DNA binding CopG/RHH family protein